MIFNLNTGFFKPEYRNQLLATLCVTNIIFGHGLGVGWLAPNIVKLQSETETPLDFYLDVHEASWVGSLYSLGGVAGCFFSALVMDRFGYKVSLNTLAIPHILLWVFTYLSYSVEILAIARIFGGITGTCVFCCIPVYLSEIADPKIRGRILGCFALAFTTGIFMGIVLGSYVPFHVFPLAALILPVLYLVLALILPETPQYLMRTGNDIEAEKSLKFYRNFKSNNKDDILQFNKDFDDLKIAVLQNMSSNTNKVKAKDFLTTESLKALGTSFVLCLVYTFSGSFTLISYISSIFEATKTDLEVETNSIVIGFIQIVGTGLSTTMIDHFGRKKLLLTALGGMGISFVFFGVYAFLAEETLMDLSAFSAWLPLLLFSLAYFFCSVGLTPLMMTIVVELMPAKIRSKGVTLCVLINSVFQFISMKTFPLLLHEFGVAAAIWFCAIFCILGLFYFSIFLKETKGKSLYKS